MGVNPKIGGFYPPKWMVKIMVPNPIKMDDLGGFPRFLEIPKLTCIKYQKKYQVLTPQVLPAARWVSSWLRFRLISAEQEVLEV